MYGIGLGLKVLTSSIDIIMGQLGWSDPVWYMTNLGGKKMPYIGETSEDGSEIDSGSG